jgi:hypothetical protein
VGEGCARHRTRSLMGFEPMVRTRWQTSWITKTVMRREGMVARVGEFEGWRS